MGEVLYSVSGPKTVFEMTWREVEEARSKGANTAIIGVGAVEQHGPHLPLGADTIQVTEIVKRTVTKLQENDYPSIAGPTIPFGFSSHHMPWPGTITLSPETLRAVIKEVSGSLVKHGFNRIALVLGHGGNYGAMMDAAQELVLETEAEALVLNWLLAVREKYPELLVTKRRDGHGGEAETSRVMAVHPELIEMDRSRIVFMDKDEPPVKYAEVVFFGGGLFKAARSYAEASTIEGTIGDPTLARAELGDTCYDIAADWSSRVILSQWQKK